MSSAAEDGREGTRSDRTERFEAQRAEDTGWVDGRLACLLEPRVRVRVEG